MARWGASGNYHPGCYRGDRGAADLTPTRKHANLKKLLLDAHSNLNNLTFPEAASCKRRALPPMFSRSEESGIDITGWAILVVAQDQAMRLDAFYVDQTSLPDGELDILLQLVDSVRFQPYTMPTPAPTATPDTAPTAAKAGNLRAGPSTNYAVVGGVKVGEKLIVPGQESGRCLATSSKKGDDEVWISTQLVTKTDAPPGASGQN